jgi:predicted enzyme related to lactoylglutathione lyase
MEYIVLNAGERGIGGIMALPEMARAAGRGPGWLGYIAVDDADAAADRIIAACGAVHRPPADIPGVGRFAVVSDPQGGTFMILKPMPPAGVEPPAPAAPGTVGHVGWHELHSSDQEAALGFYSGQFGWTRDHAFDMGGWVGTYQLFATGGDVGGGIMGKRPEDPAPFWLYYFTVADIDAAVARIADSAGKVINGPHQVPGGAWIVQGLDPQGGLFALTGPRPQAG